MSGLINKLKSTIYDINYNFAFLDSAIDSYSNNYKSRAYKKRIDTLNKKIYSLESKYKDIIDLNENNEDFDDELKSKYSKLDLLIMYFNITQDNEFIDKLLFKFYKNKNISYLESVVDYYLENVEYV